MRALAFLIHGHVMLTTTWFVGDGYKEDMLRRPEDHLIRLLFRSLAESEVALEELKELLEASADSHDSAPEKPDWAHLTGIFPMLYRTQPSWDRYSESTSHDTLMETAARLHKESSSSESVPRSSLEVSLHLSPLLDLSIATLEAVKLNGLIDATCYARTLMRRVLTSNRRTAFLMTTSRTV